MLIFRTTNRGYTSKIYGDGITARSVKADDIVLLTDYESNITVKIAYYDINDNFLGLYNFTNLAPGSVYGAYTMSHDAAYLAYLHTIPSAVIANRGLLKFSFQFIDANGVVKNTPIFTENISDSVYTIDSDTQPTIVLDNRYWPIANTNQVGLVKVDGTTITADADGTIHSAGGTGDITELKGNIDAHTANLLNPTITNATLKEVIDASAATVNGGILNAVELKGTIQADAAEINNPTLNEAAINNATFTGNLVGNGAHIEGFTFAGAIDKTTEVPTMGTSAKSVATKGYADTVLEDAKAYADSISHGATAYVYSDEAALYSRMTISRSEFGEGQYEYSITEIKDINDAVINLDTLNLGTNFLFETGDGSRWLAKKIFFSSEALDVNAAATKAMFFKLYDNDSTNYVSKTEFNTTTADLQNQITAADNKIDDVNTSLSAITGELTTQLEAETNNREAADTAINTTIDNLSKAMPTDIKGNGNKIYLVHDGTKLTPQTDVEFKTVNGVSIIGSGNIPAGSSTTVVVIDAPADATNGNLTASQLATLRENKGNLLEFNNEIYYLNDDEHKPGSLVYTHSGYNQGVSGMRKYISITIATAAWTLIVEDSSNKLDKVSTTTTYAQAYVKTASGSQQMVNVADSVVVSSIPYRSANGTIKTADPVDDGDAATLKWVNRNAKVSNVEVADNTAAIKNELGDSLATFSLKTVNGNSLFGTGDIAVSGGGVEVIEKTADQNGTFTAPLTADEFNKLAANTATLKLTYMMYGFLPVVVNLANPVSATVQSNTTLAYTVGVPSALNVVLLPTIVSTDLTKIDLSIQIKDSTPITATGNDDKYDSISDYPLLGFAEDVADVPQLAIPKSFLIGSCLYSNGTWNWDSPSGVGIVSTKYLDSWLTHINLYTTDTNATTLEAILLIKTESTLPGAEAYKRYSTIVHIGGTNTESSSGKLGSEGLFTVYDTTTHKPTYITFEVVGDLTNRLQIPTFKAYQDGADITTTYLTKVYGIEFYLL